MNKIHFILNLFFLFTLFCYGQKENPVHLSKKSDQKFPIVNTDFCGTDFIHEEKMKTDEKYRLQHETTNERIKNLTLQKTSLAGIYQVPVVVHVMHKGETEGTGTNISDDDVRNGISYLNAYWRKMSGTNGDGNGVDMEVEFILAIRDEAGNCTNGINRVDMSAVTSYVDYGVNRDSINGLDDYKIDAPVNSLKEYANWDPTSYYNVWIVDEIDGKNCYSSEAYTAGYAYYASAHGQAYDGSVVLICSYLNENSSTWAHEMGHAMNLPHTFNGDNNGTTCGDDGISDTPSHKRTSSLDFDLDDDGYSDLYFDCNNTDVNDCDPTFNAVMSPTHTGNGTHQDHIHNYMDYSGCTNEFTTGQRTVVKTALTGVRASYISGNALTPPAIAEVDFKCSSSVVCSSTTVQFTDLSSCTPNAYTNSGYDGITFSWSFDNGVDTPLTSTDQNPNITFSNSGYYDATLTITNAQGTSSTTKTDFVLVTSAASAPCSFTSTNNDGNYGCGVLEISLNTLTNSTSTFIPVNPIQDFSCTANTVMRLGTDYTLDLLYKSRSDGAQFLEAWIDWDNSGTFDISNTNGTNERIHTHNILQGITATTSVLFSPPATATQNAMLKMRIITDYKQTPTVCGNGFVQRADDYGVYVKAACVTPVVTENSNTLTASISGGAYQWIDCDTTIPIPLENGQSFIPQDSGNYSVEVTKEGCTITSDCVQYNILSVNSSLFKNVKLYPVPNNGIVHLDLGGLNDVSLKVFNIYGQVLYTRHIIDAPEIQFELNTSTGIYLIQLEHNNTTKTFKLIKE